MADHFRFSPNILRRLGEELIPNVDQGILELARNAYDADAINCRVELINAEQQGGTLRICDDGVGMTPEAIRNGWLVLGRSTKANRQPTKMGRSLVGDKGLGRLAALRLGSIARLRTRPEEEPGVEYCLALDWTRYDGADVVENVDLEIVSSQTIEGHGTTIEVMNLGIRIGRREVQRLARALLLLADPFDDSSGFHPQLIAPAFKDLERRVHEAYFDDAEYRLIATLDEAGHASAQVFDRSGRERWTANHQMLSKGPRKTFPPYKTSPAKFELWAFNFNPQTFLLRASRTELSEWLSAVGGVHLYHRGLRVHPYGDPGFDWLEMNLARVRSPELRPSTNTSLGRVLVPDPLEKLVQKTDRTGFIENEAFLELRRFAKDALNWMATERLRERERRREQERTDAPRLVSEAQLALELTLDQLPETTRPAIQKAVQRLEAAREQEVKTLREDLQLYRTLGTVGTTVAVFAHESAKPVTQIEQISKLIHARGRTLLGSAYSESLGRPVDLLQKSVKALKTFAAFPLRLLTRDKRQVGSVNVHSVIYGILELFEPFLIDAGIKPEPKLVESTPFIQGSEAALEAILANLITNAVTAFSSEDADGNDRKIEIRTELVGKDRLIVRVLDNGPGITRLSVQEVWLPGRTTRAGGTGLGLTIVRDTVTDLGGRTYVLPKGELGGAEFIIEFPTTNGG